MGPDLAVLRVFWEVEGPAGTDREPALWKSKPSLEPTVPSSLAGGTAQHAAWVCAP